MTEKHSRQEAEELQKRREAHSRRMAGAKRALETAEKATENQEKPDLLRQEESFREAEAALLASDQKREAAGEIYRINLSAYSALAPKMEERSRAAREHTLIHNLYQRLNGKISGRRMDLETFVQRYHLERILQAANIRFREMTGGQFELRMVGEEMAGEGKNRGLDLMVYSAVTGKEREVRTLSGGESFMAALSLALGMADQIKEARAAIHPDVMFIDEGFGSLDDAARSQAVRVLTRMTDSSRLIGIISHVTELKTEIEDQLIVTKDEEGSHVRWQLS